MARQARTQPPFHWTWTSLPPATAGTGFDSWTLSEPDENIRRQQELILPGAVVERRHVVGVIEGDFGAELDVRPLAEVVAPTERVGRRLGLEARPLALEIGEEIVANRDVVPF